MFWIATAAGELVNLARCDLIRIRSSDSKTGKHEVVGWVPAGGNPILIFSHQERSACVQFIEELLWAKLQPLVVLDRAPEPKKGK